YRNLTGDTDDPFPFFKQLMDTAFPGTSTITTAGRTGRSRRPTATPSRSSPPVIARIVAIPIIPNTQPSPSTTRPSPSFEHLYSEVPGQRDHDAFEERLKDNIMTPVPDQAAFRIDWPAWLQTRDQRDRRMIGDLLEGQQGKEVSRKFGVSPARLSQ